MERLSVIIISSLQKLAKRKKALEKVVKNDKARVAKWQRAMTLDFMSSEESNAENDSDSEECFTIRKITWRFL